MLSTLAVYGVDISVRSAGLDIRPALTSDIVECRPEDEGKYGKLSCLLYGFGPWMKKQTHLKYDFAVLYTGYKANSQGVAWLRGICSQSKYGVVKFDFGTEKVRTAAHELGHSLGADHTFSGETVSCQYENTIMNYGNYSAGKDEYFTFSTCAAREISDLLSGKREPNRNFECLYETSAMAAQSDDEFLGQGMTLDEQCKYLDSQYPFHDREHQFPCELRCGNGHLFGRVVAALSGTSCGTNKWCRDGDCVDVSSSSGGNSVNCKANEFRCAETGTCVPESRKCDGNLDCVRGDDEWNCPTVSVRCVDWFHSCRTDVYFFGCDWFMEMYCPRTCNKCPT